MTDNVKKTKYRIFNGTDWNDVYHFETEAPQVIESTTRRFMNPDVHKINGKKFWNGTTQQEIKLTGEDINLNANNTNKISAVISQIDSDLGDLQDYINVDILADVAADGTPIAKRAEADASGNMFDTTYATKTELSNGLAGKVDGTTIGKSNGVASLDANGKVPSSQLPSFVDDVIEGTLSGTTTFKSPDGKSTLTAEAGKIYVDISSQKTYRWSGTSYVEISASLALGATSSTAFAGDRGVKLEAFVSKVGLTKSDGTYEDYVAKAKSDKDGNQINTTYQKQTLGSNIVVNGNTTNANTVVGVLTNLAKYCNGISGTISSLGNTYAKTDDVHKISSGDTAPTNAKQWDIWLDTTA